MLSGADAICELQAESRASLAWFTPVLRVLLPVTPRTDPLDLPTRVRFVAVMVSVKSIALVPTSLATRRLHERAPFERLPDRFARHPLPLHLWVSAIPPTVRIVPVRSGQTVGLGDSWRWAVGAEPCLTFALTVGPHVFPVSNRRRYIHTVAPVTKRSHHRCVHPNPEPPCPCRPVKRPRGF